jgi:hypothetical protein
MAFVLFVAFAIAALRNANELWASATFTFALLAISAALFGAIARKGRARMPWAGFAVFGWASLITGLSPPPAIGGSPRLTPDLLFTFACEELYNYISTNSTFRMEYLEISRSLEIILFGVVGAFLGRLLAVKEDPSNP